jgi:hypothetical protein
MNTVTKNNGGGRGEGTSSMYVIEELKGLLQKGAASDCAAYRYQTVMRIICLPTLVMFLHGVLQTNARQDSTSLNFAQQT